MIYICADDYGLCRASSMRIQQCIDNGALNKVSVFPNFDTVDIKKILGDKKIRLSLHLNLVEGKCMAGADKTDLLCRKDGSFKHDFGGLFKLWLLCPKKLEAQVYEEITAQVLHWKSILPQGADFCIDSHQHTHMIPAVFTALLRVLQDRGIEPDYMRIPTEPLMPYITTPSLYFTYSGINVIKQWLINFLYLINKRKAKGYKIPTSYFCGILFSGCMDYKRVNKILPKYIKLAQKRGADIEVLAHPGYLDDSEFDFKDKNVVFKKFYMSKNRKTEFDSVSKYKKGSVT